MKQTFSGVLVVVLLSGCVQVPSSRLKFGGASAFLPKNWTADQIEVMLNSGSNTMTFKATKMVSRNDPDVIGASTAQIETVINATGNAVGNAMATAAKSAIK